MCNIAGYVGTGRAAPILLDMIKKQEGFGGGYYSGIATLHEGKIHHAKLTGSFDRLLELTAAASLPGNIGIIHSRSNSGGGDEWAHPFIGTGGGTAYIANGSPGVFGALDSSDTQRKTLARLVDAGCKFPSRETGKIGKYPTLPDGSCVHMSDVMCQLATLNAVSGMCGAEALGRAFHELPSEIVGVLLTASEGDRLTVARINQPMNVGFSEDGAFLSTAALAFPERVTRVVTLPHNAASVVTAGGFTSTPFRDPPAEVEDITPGIWAKGYAAAEEALFSSEAKPLSVGALAKLLKPLFKPDIPAPTAHFAYELIREFMAQGRMETVKTTVRGAAEGIMAPNFNVKAKKAR